MLWLSSKANPILPETTDCIQSKDYLYTKPDSLANLDSSAKLQPSPAVLGMNRDEDLSAVRRGTRLIP
jgi:hypothetical protein